MKENIVRQNRPSFLSSVLTMMTAQLAVKLMGLIYRLVITNIEGFGDVGNGFYTAGFQIYTLMLAISSTGIPNAISKLVSTELAKGNRSEAYRIFRTALLLFFGIGLVCSAGLFFGAEWIAKHVIQMDGVQYTLRALAPSITFVCVSSVIRGWFLGHGDVTASSFSQVLEQAVKSALTVIFVLLLSSASAEIMSAGANFATTTATAVTAAYLALYYVRRKESYPGYSRRRRNTPSFRKRCFRILAVSIPVSMSSMILAIGRVVDTATITRGISSAFAQGIPGQPGILTAAALNGEAVRLAGMLSKSDALINLPLALNIAFSTVLVPSVSYGMAAGRLRETRRKISSSLLISIFLILPCAGGLIVLAEPIYRLIYPNAPDGYRLLQISAVGMVFMALTQTISGSLQGLGKTAVPAKAFLCGAVVKTVLNCILIPIPSINIYGAALSSVACHITAFTICFYQLRKTLVIRISFLRHVGKSLLYTAVMSGAAVVIYPTLFRTFHSNAMSVLFTVTIAIALYIIQILRT